MSLSKELAPREGYLETIREKATEAIEKLGKAAKKLGAGLEAAAEKLEEKDIPRLSRNIMILSITAMGIYTAAIAISTMLPYAAIAFQQMGIVFGYFIPLMIMFTLASMIITLVRKAIGR